MLGFGIVIPILPFYVEHFGGSGKDMGMLMAIYSIMQFIFSPIWGSLSDHYGRKPILLVGIIGNVVSQVLYGMVGDFAEAGNVRPANLVDPVDGHTWSGWDSLLGDFANGDGDHQRPDQSPRTRRRHGAGWRGDGRGHGPRSWHRRDDVWHFAFRAVLFCGGHFRCCRCPDLGNGLRVTAE